MLLLIRDSQHHFSILETQATAAAPLHITQPCATRSSQQTAALYTPPTPPGSCPASPIPALPLDVLLLITSLAPFSTLSALTAVNHEFNSAFSHAAHWRQLSHTLGWQQNRPLERVPWRPFVLTRHSSLTSASLLWWQLRGKMSGYGQATLREPLPLADLLTCERALGALLPPSLRASLLVHDGQTDNLPVNQGLIDGCRLLSGREIAGGGVVEASDMAGGSGRLVGVTSESGVNCVLVSVVDGSVWLRVGSSGVLVWQCDDWLQFLDRFFRLSAT